MNKRNMLTLTIENNSFLEEMMRKWYKNGVKQVPEDIADTLEAVSLTAWLQEPDRVTKMKDSGRICIHSSWYSETDAKRMINAMKKKFGIDGTIECCKTKCTGTCIMLDKPNADKLIKILKQSGLLIPCFERLLSQ